MKSEFLKLQKLFKTIGSSLDLFPGSSQTGRCVLVWEEEPGRPSEVEPLRG